MLIRGLALIVVGLTSAVACSRWLDPLDGYIVWSCCWVAFGWVALNVEFTRMAKLLGWDSTPEWGRYKRATVGQLERWHPSRGAGGGRR